MVDAHYIPLNPLIGIEKEGLLRIEIGQKAFTFLRSVVDNALSFFRLPLQDKLSNSYGNDMGYRAMRQQYSRSPDSPDQVESFSVSLRHSNLIDESSTPLAAELCSKLTASVDILAPLAEEIIFRIANALPSSNKETLHRYSFRRWSLLQLNYSRPSEIAGQIVNDLHEDGCLLTLASTTGPGLEIQKQNGLLVPLAMRERELLALPGEILSLLSGGHIRPLYHRVVADSSCPERLSMLFFGDIDPKHCQPWVVNDFNRNVDIGTKVLTNSTRFGLAQWAPD